MSTINPGMFTSTTSEWPTPRELYDTLDAEFAFTLDPAASRENAKCARFYTAVQNGLARPWPGRVFCNPPFGRVIGEWVAKCYAESRANAELVVALLPVRTDTGYWHEFVMHAAEIRFIRNRLRFERPAARSGHGHNAPFPSAVVVFQPEWDGPPACSAIDREGRPIGPAPYRQRWVLGLDGAGNVLRADREPLLQHGDGEGWPA